MSLYLLRIDLGDDSFVIPGLESEVLRIVGNLLDFFDIFVTNDWLHLVVRVMDNELLDGLVWHFGCLLLCSGSLHVELLVAEGLMCLTMAQAKHGRVLRVLDGRAELIVLHAKHWRVEAPIGRTRGTRVAEQSLV